MQTQWNQNKSFQDMVQCYQSMFIEIIKENNLSIYTILINSYGYV